MKGELEKLCDYITEGAIIRSKAQCYEEGENKAAIFFNLEGRNKVKSSIHKLKLSEDSDYETDDFQHIQKELKAFYQNLYKCKSLKTERECLKYL